VELRYQLRALFGDEQNFDNAESEILALAYFAELGRLRAVGWPNHYRGGAPPPFDGLALIHNIELPFDVKSASGSASQLLRDALTPIAERWAAGRWRVAIEMRTGTITRVSIGRHKRALEGEFRRRLDAYETLPAENIDLTAGRTPILVTVRPYGVVISKRANSPADHSASVEETLRTHVEEKAQRAAENNACGFFLVYVRPPLCGTVDLRQTSFLEAANHLAQSCESMACHQMWLASVMLDWTSGDWTPVEQPRIHIVCNPRAAWPSPLSEANFGVSLTSNSELLA
jgi:hypothetical protein